MSASIKEDAIPGIAPTFRFQWEEAQNCYVILYPEGMVKLSPSAGAIMKYIDGASSLSSIVADLKQEFPGADLEADVYKFLEVANENGWIRFK